jgi:chromatin remodeling complex protein RSC6
VIGTAEKQRILELEQVLIEYVERYGLSPKAREVLGQDPNPRTNRVKSVWKHWRIAKSKKSTRTN